MSDPLPQRNARRGASPAHSMGTSSLDQSNLSSGAPHGARPTTRSQASVAATADDRAPTEIHQGPEYPPAHGQNSALRAEVHVRREEEKHWDSYNSPSSKRAARDKQLQEDAVRAPTSGARDKLYPTIAGELSDGRRNLQHEQSGSIPQNAYKDREQSKREAGGTKQRTPVTAQGERVPESSSAQVGVFTRATRFLTGHPHDPITSPMGVDVLLLMKQYEDALKEEQKLKQELHSVQKTAQRDSRLWNSEYRKMVNRINELENQLEKERLEKLQHQRRVDKIAAHIDNQEFFIGIQMSDSGILGLWHSLWVQVKGWSIAFSSDHPIDKRMLEEREWVKTLRTVAPGDSRLRLLDRRKTRRELVQAIVGYTLAEGVFRRLSNDESSPPEEGTSYVPVLDHWTPEHRDAIDNLERAFSKATQSTITVRELNDWRAFTVSLVSRMHPASKMQEQTSIIARYYAPQLMNMISGWAKPSETREALESSITAILQKALEFAIEIRKQRAYWSVELPCRSTEFNEELMEDVDADPDERDHTAKAVELYLFPGLYKQGNADGEHFDVKRCFVKGKVKCTG